MIVAATSVFGDGSEFEESRELILKAANLKESQFLAAIARVAAKGGVITVVEPNGPRTTFECGTSGAITNLGKMEWQTRM